MRKRWHRSRNTLPADLLRADDPKRRVLLTLSGAALVVLFAGGPAQAQVTVCSATGFSASPGTAACSGASRPITVTATVKTYAKLTMEEVFGNPAVALQIAMGDVDATCTTPTAPGVHCVADQAVGAATWYGDLRMRVQLAGVGSGRGKLIGWRPTAGTMPSGRMLDGAAGAVPTVAYPLAPATPVDLVSGLAPGETVVTRSLGLRVLASDPPGSWSGTTAFSLVLE